VRQARQWSGLDWPIAVVSALRPEWLAAVADEAGVAKWSLAEALENFAAVD
jgi:hypothetical protein